MKAIGLSSVVCLHTQIFGRRGRAWLDLENSEWEGIKGTGARGKGGPRDECSRGGGTGGTGGAVRAKRGAEAL